MKLLLNKTELCKQLSIAPRTLEYMIKRNEFPPPVRLGKYVYWSELAVENWQLKKFSSQESWNS
jgi:predicted DNA-binding transcriptional regulator AlpA